MTTLYRITNQSVAFNGTMWLYCIVFLFVLRSSQSADGDRYTVKTVQYAPKLSPPITNLDLNIKSFYNFIIKDKGTVDVVIFPENALNGFGECFEEMLTTVPDPKMFPNSVPCGNTNSNYSDALRNMSCAAQEASAYVVVNLVEKEFCYDSECPSSGRRLYNTNVVFSRNGTIIARYRKFNLFGEADKNVPSNPDMSYFSIDDRQIRIGLFTCFDILFEEPALNLVNAYGIRNIIFPTAWFSELPFLTAVQAQFMWSYATDTNFIASGYVDPSLGCGGGSIIAGSSGVIAMDFPASSTSSSLIAEITDKPRFGSSPPIARETFTSSEDVASQVKLKTEDLEKYTLESIELGSAKNVCYNLFCCLFEIDYELKQGEVKYEYRAAVFDGIRTFSGIKTGGIQACAIISCENKTRESCGKPISSSHVFTSISISGDFNGNRTLIMPSTVQQNLLPLKPNNFQFSKHCNGGSCYVELISSKSHAPISNLLTYGIYSRVFERDGQKVTGSASFHYPNWLVPILACMTTFKLWVI